MKPKLPSLKKVASFAKKAWKSDAGNYARKKVMHKVNSTISKSKPFVTKGLAIAGTIAGEMIGGPAGAVTGGELGNYIGKKAYGTIKKVGASQESKIDRHLKTS